MPQYSSDNIPPAAKQYWEDYWESLGAIGGSSVGFAVTPSDTADLPNGISKFIYATGAGVINILFADNAPGQELPVIFAAGEVKQIHARRIYATSTTATGIQAWS